MDVSKVLNTFVVQPKFEVTKINTKVIGDTLKNAYLTLNTPSVNYYIPFTLDGSTDDPKTGIPGIYRIFPRGDSNKTVAGRYLTFGVGRSTTADTAGLFYLSWDVTADTTGFKPIGGDSTYDPKVGKSEIFSITARADASDDLRHKYFRIALGPNAGDTRFVVFKKLYADTLSTFCVPGKVIPVYCTTNIPAIGAARKIFEALDGYQGKLSVLHSYGTNVTVKVLTPGNIVNAADVNVGGTFAITTPVSGIDAVAGLASKTRVKIPLKRGDTKIPSAKKAFQAINAGDTGLFYATYTAGDSSFFLKAKYGATVVAASAVNDGSTITQGTLTTQASAKPVVALKNAISIPVANITGDSGGKVALRMKTAIDLLTPAFGNGLDSFTTSRLGDTLTITAKRWGQTTDATNATAPAALKVVVNTQGDSGVVSMLSTQHSSLQNKCWYYVPEPNQIAVIRSINIMVGDTNFFAPTLFGNRVALATTGLSCRFMTGYGSTGDTQKKLLFQAKNNADLTSIATTSVLSPYSIVLGGGYGNTMANYIINFGTNFGEEVTLDGNKGDYLRFDLGDSTAAQLATLQINLQGKLKVNGA